MTNSYFQRVRATTPTRLWINNPTEAEVGLALAQGAAGCTTNPAFGGGLLKRAPDEALPIIRAACAETEDDTRAAELVQLKLVKKLTDAFLPLFESSGGREGFVSIQGAPEADTDGKHILREAHEGHALAPNAAPKIPGTLPGFYAFERLVAAGYPTIVTEVFSLDQLVYACETYIRASAASGLRPPFFMSPITGILGDHLRKVAKATAADIDPSDIEWAGVALARACQALVEERRYPVTLLFGGARIPLDFIGLVGGAHAATINYSTVAELIEADPEVADTIHQQVDPAIVERLSATFEDFRRGMQARLADPRGVRGVRTGPTLPRRLHRRVARRPGRGCRGPRRNAGTRRVTSPSGSRAAHRPHNASARACCRSRTNGRVGGPQSLTPRQSLAQEAVDDDPDPEVPGRRSGSARQPAECLLWDRNSGLARATLRSHPRVASFPGRQGRPPRPLRRSSDSAR